MESRKESDSWAAFIVEHGTYSNLPILLMFVPKSLLPEQWQHAASLSARHAAHMQRLRNAPPPDTFDDKQNAAHRREFRADASNYSALSEITSELPRMYCHLSYPYS